MLRSLDSRKLYRHRCNGSMLVVAMVFVGALAAIAALTLSYASSRYAATFQAASWHQAGSAAEAGVEIALNALRRSILEGPDAWAAWEPKDQLTQFPKQFSEVTFVNTGEGNQRVRVSVEVSRPSGDGTLNPTTVPEEQSAYLIRAVGRAGIPGPARLAMNGSDRALRKLSFFYDFRTGQKVTTPEVSRAIEAIAAPVNPFPLAVHSQERIEIKSGKNMVIDSFDSAVGPYSAGAREERGNIGTNGERNEVIRLENVTVYGNAAKHGGTAEVKSNALVTGEIINGFYREMKPVRSPRNDATFVPIQGSPASADRKNETIKTSKPGEPPLLYKLSKIHLHDGETLQIQPQGGAGGSAFIWVTGDTVVHNGGKIEIKSGANVTFYFEKNVTIEEKSGNPGFVNENGKAATAQIYGVPIERKKRKFKIKGDMTAAVYAPDHELEVKLKSGRHFYGAMSGRTVKIEGETQIHYDEALGEKGKPYDYTIASWMEDWFEPKRN